MDTPAAQMVLVAHRASEQHLASILATNVFQTVTSRHLHNPIVLT